MGAYFMRKQFTMEKQQREQQQQQQGGTMRRLWSRYNHSRNDIKNILTLPRRIELNNNNMHNHQQQRVVDNHNNKQQHHQYQQQQRRASLSFVSNDTMYYQLDAE